MESVKFGEKIKAARKAAGLTQTELASQVGVTMRTIQLYEANDRQPKNAGVMLKLAKALSVPLDYFMSKEELEHMREQEQFIRDATGGWSRRSHPCSARAGKAAAQPDLRAVRGRRAERRGSRRIL